MHFKMLSAICFNLDQSKILLSGNELSQKPVENNVEKGKNAGNHHFVIFLQRFLPYQNLKLLFKVYFVVCKCFQFGLV